MGRGAVGIAGLLLGAGLLASGCTGGAEAPAPPVADPRTERLEELAEDPSALLAEVQRRAQRDTARVATTPAPEDGGADAAYVLVVGDGAWRAEVPAAEGEGTATVLRSGDRLCFDRGFRPRVRQPVAESYGTVAFDPPAWTCTPVGFGLNTLVTHGLLRADPRTRIAGLVADGATVEGIETEAPGGEPLLHLRTSGVTADGPLDPARPTYDLWVDADLRAVRMAGAGVVWTFERPAGLAAQLAPPPAGRTGSYGYAVGPGQGVAKACRQSGQCPERAPSLTWGDGRRS
ncbi:hypothetical protein [Nocardioides marmotae]|uniref:Lipoprotein n=1 Tax=Nocardioides marmotae TaxID=2663857 RepID=A0A6I3JFT0_9ACTN|nr:hypothetical protein [Nocardioides marmotae]MCR6033334.1 hypothetical protein [Gordonia jinghuaiqii]MBC9734087.1 hypothetical protein [Nocardioides marmotae]MTB85190.1 hypothetical protein [Nocardioides marmotae]MTB96991.1 hypothetical protein [Nocardioides marmotae]QKE00630.1 hypothetical protein HPC71_05695 [Nocardioides marmotae]